jgi:PIN domain nuclease of toxin-antitoxin system
MRLLLDTHVALWVIADPTKLSKRALDLLNDLDNTCSVSAVTIWEIAIKHPLSGRRVGRMPVSSARALELFGAAGFELLAVTPRHAVAVEALPPLHSDPFDRMLVAQAITEPMRLVTADGQVAAYDPSIILI